MSLSKGRIGLVQRLQQRRRRQREACFIVEGIRAATAALEAGADVRFAVTAPRLATLDRDGRFADALGLAHFEVVAVDDNELQGLTDTVTPQGVLLVCNEPAVTLDSLLEGMSQEAGSTGVLVADAIQDPANLGSMIRTAAALGLAGLVALDGTVDPWSSKVVRGSAGGSFRIPVVGAAGDEFLDWARERDVTILAAEAGGGEVSGNDGDAPWALLVGNEGAGVRPELRDAAHQTVAVPIRPTADSLNAGVAAAILCYELLRDRRS